MQTALFKCSNLLKDDEIIDEIGKYIKKLFSSKGLDVVNKNIRAMEIALNSATKVDIFKLQGKEYKNDKI